MVQSWITWSSEATFQDWIDRARLQTLRSYVKQYNHQGMTDHVSSCLGAGDGSLYRTWFDCSPQHETYRPLGLFFAVLTIAYIITSEETVN